MLDNFTNSDQPRENYQSRADDGVDIGELITTLFDSKWLIIFVTIIVTALGVAKALLDTPIYTADALLQVRESSPSVALGVGGSSLLGAKVPVNTELQIIKSRMILGLAVKKLNIDIIAQPKYFPYIGLAIARSYQLRNSDKVSDALFEYPHYAWGGEIIKVDTLDVPDSWIGKGLLLIAGKKGKFNVMDPNDKLFVQGEIGKLITMDIDGEDSQFRLFVSQLIAREDTHFNLIKQSQAGARGAIGSLQNSLKIHEKGKGTGILEFSIESSSPFLAMKTLNTIADIYVRMNVEQKSAEAQKTLEFLNKHLPVIKKQMDAATIELNEYKLKIGAIDLQLETKRILDQDVDVRARILVLEQKRDEFTDLYPAVIGINLKISKLLIKLEENEVKISELPKKQQVVLRLSRDVDLSTVLYTKLLNNLQTLKIARAGTVGDVRVIDYALLPSFPIKPKKKSIVGMAFILGLLIGIVLAFIRKALNKGIKDPDIIEKRLNVPVYAMVPHSNLQQKLNKQVKKNKTHGDKPIVLAVENNDDMAIESLRSLRTTLHFAFLEAKNNIIMITGSSPGVGKTFISTNLAIVLANSGKKILLIDADLRKGFINKALGVSRKNGLSDIILNTITSDEAIHSIEKLNIDFIATGTIPPNPSELLLNERFSIMLENMEKQYDYIIIDSPPVLAVTDACIIGRLASAILLVVRAGAHPVKELQQCMNRLKQNNLNIKGVVFNDVPIPSSKYGYGYGYGKYVYQYNYQK